MATLRTCRLKSRPSQVADASQFCIVLNSFIRAHISRWSLVEAIGECLPQQDSYSGVKLASQVLYCLRSRETATYAGPPKIKLGELEVLLNGTFDPLLSGAGELVNSPNVIGLTEEELDQPIFRIMPVLRCLEILHTKQLVLVRPRKWDDPFENALLKAQITDDESGNGTFGFRFSVYGQCWTSGGETDAMWRIYSHDKQGIKARTSPRKLLSALSGNTQTNPELCCFIGRVRYLEENDLLNYLQQLDWHNPTGSGIAASLLYKRTEFAHEKEIRLIYSSSQTLSETDPDIHKVNVNPCELIDELVLDPRMDGQIADSCTASITAMGFTGIITQSALYRAPSGFSISLSGNIAQHQDTEDGTGG